MVYSPPIAQDEARDALAALPGCGPGAQVLTDQGEVPVDWLAAGDRVLTRDHGFQPLLWVGRARTGPGEGLSEVAAGALGKGQPSHPTLLAPRTRVMLSGWEVALNTGADEALAMSADLFAGATATPLPSAGGLLRTHLLLPMHEVVQINALWVETLLLDSDTRGALEGILPPHFANRPAIATGHRQTIRPCLTPWEVTAIRAGRATTRPAKIARVA